MYSTTQHASMYDYTKCPNARRDPTHDFVNVEHMFTLSLSFLYTLNYEIKRKSRKFEDGCILLLMFAWYNIAYEIVLNFSYNEQIVIGNLKN